MATLEYVEISCYNYDQSGENYSLQQNFISEIKEIEYNLITERKIQR